MKTRLIFAAVAALVLAVGVWMALGDSIDHLPPAPVAAGAVASAPEPTTAEIIPGISDAPDVGLVTPARPEAHASVRVTIPTTTDPPPRPARTVPRDAEFVQLDRPIIGTINGRPTIIEPGYYRIFRPNNQMEEF